MEKQLPIFDCGLDDDGNFTGIQAISLVDIPAIESNFVALSKAKEIGVMEKVMFKAAPDAEKKMIYGPVLIPDKLIYRNDERGEYYIRMSQDTIEQCRELYMKKHLQSSATLMHEIAVTGLTVVESWTKLSDQDKSNALGFSEPVGTWFIGMKCDDEKIWEGVKDGTFKGFSVESFFTHTPSEESQLIAELQKAIASVD